MRKMTTLAMSMALAFFLAAPGVAQTPQASTTPSTIWTSTEGEWMPLPDIFPPGGQFKVMNGNPATGPSDMYFRLPAGYGVPWHFHSPAEKVLIDAGTLRVEMRNRSVVEIVPGTLFMAPPRAPHRVTCVSGTECLFYLISDAPFDIHLVDANWNTTESWYASGSPPARRVKSKE